MRTVKPERGRSVGRMILVDMRRAFGSWTVWVGALLLFVALAIPVADNIFTGSDLSYLNAIDRFLFTFIASGGGFLAPVLCCLPMGVSFSDDYLTGFGWMTVQRIGIRRYLLGRILSTALSGGFTLFLGVVLHIAFCFIVFTGDPNIDPNLASYLDAHRSWGAYSWLPEGVNAGYWLMLAYGLQYFLWGAVWAVAGLAFSALVVNRYAALALPFIVVITLWYLFGRLRLLYLSSYSYLHPYGIFSSLWHLLIGYGVQLALFSSLFLLAGRRRLLHG
jgi:hypothetical protein